MIGRRLADDAGNRLVDDNGNYLVEFLSLASGDYGGRRRPQPPPKQDAREADRAVLVSLVKDQDDATMALWGDLAVILLLC